MKRVNVRLTPEADEVYEYLISEQDPLKQGLRIPDVSGIFGIINHTRIQVFTLQKSPSLNLLYTVLCKSGVFRSIRRVIEPMAPEYDYY